jgi:hypothetical protein
MIGMQWDGLFLSELERDGRCDKCFIEQYVMKEFENIS